MLKTLLVGERTNGRGFNISSRWEHLYDSPAAYWTAMTHAMTFTKPQQKLLVDRLGLKWDQALNLLVPHQVPGFWEPEKAEQAAEMVLEILGTRSKQHWLILCCGSRVYRAFGYKATTVPMGTISTLGNGRTSIARVPHPSGLNKQWNDEALVAEIAERYKVNLKLLKESVPCSAK